MSLVPLKTVAESNNSDRQGNLEGIDVCTILPYTVDGALPGISVDLRFDFVAGR